MTVHFLTYLRFGLDVQGGIYRFEKQRDMIEMGEPSYLFLGSIKGVVLDQFIQINEHKKRERDQSGFWEKKKVECLSLGVVLVTLTLGFFSLAFLGAVGMGEGLALIQSLGLVLGTLGAVTCFFTFKSGFLALSQEKKWKNPLAYLQEQRKRIGKSNQGFCLVFDEQLKGLCVHPKEVSFLWDLFANHFFEECLEKKNIDLKRFFSFSHPLSFEKFNYAKGNELEEEGLKQFMQAYQKLKEVFINGAQDTKKAKEKIERIALELSKKKEEECRNYSQKIAFFESEYNYGKKSMQNQRKYSSGHLPQEPIVLDNQQTEAECIQTWVDSLKKNVEKQGATIDAWFKEKKEQQDEIEKDLMKRIALDAKQLSKQFQEYVQALKNGGSQEFFFDPVSYFLDEKNVLLKLKELDLKQCLPPSYEKLKNKEAFIKEHYENAYKKVFS